MEKLLPEKQLKHSEKMLQRNFMVEMSVERKNSLKSKKKERKE